MLNQLEMNEDCRFLIDVVDNPRIARYNLITSKVGVGLFIKGIKPNRHWTLKSVKEYFGITGNKYTIQTKLYLLDKICKGELYKTR